MDNLGNRTGDQTLRSDGTVDFTVQSSTNRYTSIGGHSISHDDAGNLTVDKDGYQYTYDYENRVVKIEKPDGLGGWDDVAEMAYDALGRRIRVIDSVASVTTLYYYNPEWQCLAEYSGAGTLQRYFVYGNYIDEPLVMHRQNDGEDYYYGQDHLYSTVVLLDDGGNVAERYEYDAYGTAHIMDASYNSRTVSSYGNPYTFTGRRLDVLDGGDLKHKHLRHRDTDPYTGRFINQDQRGINPAGGQHNRFSGRTQYSDGMNLYQGVSDNPVNISDPWGLWGTSVHYTKTFMWARRVGYPGQAARVVASANEAVDGDFVVPIIGLPIGDTAPIPIYGDQSYHFNRNINGGTDSRLEHYYEHFTQARLFCLPAFDMPFTAARELGTALHPYQDMIAHGDYGLHNTGDIWIHHNSQSPQDEFGPPGNYPDDFTLDAVGGPSGIPAGNAIILETINNTPPSAWAPPEYSTTTREYAMYQKGSQRIDLTRARTVGSLEYYRNWVSVHGGCRCKRFFGIIP